MSIHDVKIMKTQINDNLKNNKKSINLIGDKGYIEGGIIGIKFIIKINEVNEVPN